MDLSEQTEMWMKEVAVVRKEMFPKVVELQRKLLERETEALIEYTKNMGEAKKIRTSSEIRAERKSLAPFLEMLKTEPFAAPKWFNADEISGEIAMIYNYKIDGNDMI